MNRLKENLIAADRAIKPASPQRNLKIQTELQLDYFPSKSEEPVEKCFKINGEIGIKDP